MASGSIRSAIDPDTGWSVWGQAPAVSALQAALDRGPGHAYIFSGPSGSGRRLVALEFARALCCPEAEPGGPPCGDCSVCGRIERGVFPDVTVFDLASQAVRDKDKSRNLTLNIATVREVAAAVAYRPAEARWRVVIVDDAETMQETAQEAFLKTLEEPPAYAVIILLATDTDGLLPTILSRCRVVRFGSSSPASIEAALTAAGVESNPASRIAATAEGSMGWAFDAADDGSLIDQRETSLREAFDFVSAAAYDRVVRAFLLADEFSKDRDGVYNRLQLVQSVWRSALHLNLDVHNAALVDATLKPHRDAVIGMSRGDLVRAIRSVDTCIANLEANVRPRLALESMVIAWPRMNT